MAVAVAVAVWLVTLWALPAMAGPVPSLPAREQMLGLLERQALHRDRVDWMTLRRDLAATGDPERQRRLLAEAINRATAGHGGWMSAGELRDRSRRTEHTAPMSLRRDAPTRCDWRRYGCCPNRPARENLRQRAGKPGSGSSSLEKCTLTPAVLLHRLSGLRPWR